jgi:hypothetical protein
MSEEILLRTYEPRDFQAIQRIHKENSLDFKFPNLNSGQFLVNKVLEVEGQTRASYALKVTAESYLWLDRSGWTDAAGRWATVKALDKEVTETAASLGIDSLTLCLPPGYERFGKRIRTLGFNEIRPDWTVFTKEIQ